MQPISLTGIKPTGSPHIGNYLGMIRPALQLVQNHQALYFIADYHALTTLHDGGELKRRVYEVAATWLALGLNPDEVLFYRQSDVPEVFELSWILDCFTPKGLLNRAHAYKAAVDSNLEVGNTADDGINAGLYNYPVLMAADILLFGAHIVPVGQDQKQHIEVARDIAHAVNTVYGDVLTLPEAYIDDDVKIIQGIDGRKMSKSYNNTIEVFAPAKVLHKQVKRIVTDSLPPEAPKDPESCNVFALYRHFAAPEDVLRTRSLYLQGGLAYGTLKQELYELVEAKFSKPREKYHALLNSPDHLDKILQDGAARARGQAQEIMGRVREAIGAVNRRKSA